MIWNYQTTCSAINFSSINIHTYIHTYIIHLDKHGINAQLGWKHFPWWQLQSLLTPQAVQSAVNVFERYCFCCFSTCKNLLRSIMYFTWWRWNLYSTANDIARFYFFLDTDCQSKGWGLSTSAAYTQVFMVHKVLSTDANWHWRC